MKKEIKEFIKLLTNKGVAAFMIIVIALAFYTSYFVS